MGRSSRTSLAVIALVLAAVALLSVNLAARQGLKLARADLTQNGLFTISDSTKQVLGRLEDPVTLRLYYSKALGARAPNYGQYAERVSNLLSVYSDLSHGKLTFETVDPEPFSDAEDRAVAAGLQGVSLGEGQDTAYLGLVGTNSTDDREVISFFSLERADFLEYDLTKMVLKLADPKRKVVGLLTDLPMQGGMDPQRGPQPAWLAMQQLEEFFTVKAVAPDAGEIPADVDLLLIVSPVSLSDKAAFAVDQFALKGKPVLAFADPYTELRPMGSPQLQAGSPLLKLLDAWGAKMEPGKVLADIAYARQVQYGSAVQPQVADYVAWMTLDKGTFDGKDALFSNIDRVVLASPGALEPAGEAGDRFKPLIQSSDRAMLVDASALMPPDPEKLLNDYKPGGKRLAFAARLSGDARTAFPEGAPKSEGASADTPASTAEAVKDGKINVIVVADADLLYDSFWAERRQLLGQTFVVPRANNIDLLLNALENLTGGAALSGLRGRGVEERPFTLVREIRQEAEAKYRAQEEALNQKLQETQKRLADIQSKTQDGQVMLSEDDKNAILNFRQEVVQTRQALRNVQHSLRRDIDRLEVWTTFLNTAALPIVIAIGGLGYLAVRRRRRAAGDRREGTA